MELRKKMKRCFNCKNDLPLFMYHKLPENDYQLKTDLGRATECRLCTYERIKREGEKLHPYRKVTKLQGELRRFTSITMNKKQAFKYCFLNTYESNRTYLRNELRKQKLYPYNE